MKHPILLVLFMLPLLVHIGCTSAPSGGGDAPKTETEPSSINDERPDLIGLSYYWYSGSMAGVNYSYSISKEQAGVYLFHAEIESENLIVDKEISQEDFYVIMQMVNDNYIAETNNESEDELNEYAALDADSSSFEAVFADGHTQSIVLGDAGSEVISQLNKFLE